ncbi:MAG: hypothetical protein IBJ03_10665 [Gemmatimonadaceae bacterium]|nr:hypothetical protein [Gemmatimonadaceae bacterium]
MELQFDQWRGYLHRRQHIQAVDVAELEDHLREQVDGLRRSGLSGDEAFLVAVKRMGDLDALSREFAREHSERLWKQLVLLHDDTSDSTARLRTDAFMAWGLAVAAGVLVKVPTLFGLTFENAEGFYARHLPLFVLAMLTTYFAWKRRLPETTIRWLVAGFAAGAVFANVYPFVTGSDVEILTALHLPLALWLLVGVAYTGSRWRTVEARMDFIRYTGEFFIYYVLIALGGGVLAAMTTLVFGAIGIKVDSAFQQWIVPCGAAGGVLVATWLVEAKQSVVENMAPVLTRLFAPMFAALLLAFLVALAFTGNVIDIQREVLIGFDALLALVLALFLYTVSARDPQAPPGLFDVVQVVLVVSALAADVVALWAIGTRITEFGFTPNRVAALGENVLLLVNLAGSAVLGLRFLRGRGTFRALERWQTAYLPVFALWAALVVIVFPLLFNTAS